MGKIKLHVEPNYYKPNFVKTVFIKKERFNCLNKITDLDLFNESYNMMLDSLC